MVPRFLIVAAFLAACQGPTERVGEKGPEQPGATTAPAPGAPPAGTPAPGVETQQASAFDQLYIDHLVPHLDYGVELAEVGAERATNPALKTWSENLKTGYEARIDQLANWRKSWYGSEDTPDIENAPALTGVAPYMPGEWWKAEAKAGTSRDVTERDRVAAPTGTAGTTGSAMAWTPDDVVKALRDTADFDRVYMTAMLEHQRHTVEVARAAQTQAGRAELKTLAQQILDEEQSSMKQLEEWQAKMGTPPSDQRM